MPCRCHRPDHSEVIDTNKCITCCACIKLCPENARTMKPGLVRDARPRGCISGTGSERSRNVFYDEHRMLIMAALR
ncbi:4Fe-4S binding protein [Methanothrix soehngenii]